MLYLKYALSEIRALESRGFEKNTFIEGLAYAVESVWLPFRDPRKNKIKSEEMLRPVTFAEAILMRRNSTFTQNFI